MIFELVYNKKAHHYVLKLDENGGLVIANSIPQWDQDAMRIAWSLGNVRAAATMKLPITIFMRADTGSVKNICYQLPLTT